MCMLLSNRWRLTEPMYSKWINASSGYSFGKVLCSGLQIHRFKITTHLFLCCWVITNGGDANSLQNIKSNRVKTGGSNSAMVHWRRSDCQLSLSQRASSFVLTHSLVSSQFELLHYQDFKLPLNKVLQYSGAITVTMENIHLYLSQYSIPNGSRRQCSHDRTVLAYVKSKLVSKCAYSWEICCPLRKCAGCDALTAGVEYLVTTHP